MHDQPPKTCLASKIVYQKPWITIHEDQTVDHNGQAGIYGYMKSNDSCMAVVANEKARVLLVRAFRYPSQSFDWELPGGGGDKLAQDIDTTGVRTAHDEVFSDMQFFTPTEIDSLIQEVEINDCQTLAGLHYYRVWQAVSSTKKQW